MGEITINKNVRSDELVDAIRADPSAFSKLKTVLVHGVDADTLVGTSGTLVYDDSASGPDITALNAAVTAYTAAPAFASRSRLLQRIRNQYPGLFNDATWAGLTAGQRADQIRTAVQDLFRVLFGKQTPS